MVVKPGDSPSENAVLPTCSVVICCYTEQRWDDTLRAVKSVQVQQPAPREVIVVVDHNPDLHVRLAAALPGVTVVANHHEQGLSGARNTGAEMASADVVAFLDDDAAARPGWLARLAMNYADRNVLGVGGRIEPDWGAGRPRWFPPEFDWVVGCDYAGQRTGVVRNLIGANASFRRDLFDNDGFVSGIGRSVSVRRPVGGEETEFCIRSAQARPGGFFVHDRAAEVIHRVPADRQTFAYFRTRCYSEGLSKALVTNRVGTEAGLASEWSYTTHTLPLGVLHGIGRVLRGDVTGLLTAAAIVAGLVYTTAGYVVGSVSGAWARRRGAR
ncbi:MAG: glycosyltransferase family 2 protein [Mycobacterium sp.]|nr:glycosyltransferase family 2 protein [Mycobacterium sp.]